MLLLLGKEVNWVQCDRCELWFHLLCVGLAANQVSENEDYHCYKCTKAQSVAAVRPPPVKRPMKPKKPVDEAVVKSYKDFLDDLDMDKIGMSKLQTMDAGEGGGGPLSVSSSDASMDI
jgi:hypothetical protein